MLVFGQEKKRRKGKFEWQERGPKNREGSLGFPGFVKPVFTKDSKTPREKEKITRAPRERETRTHLKAVAQLVAYLNLDMRFADSQGKAFLALMVGEAARQYIGTVTQRICCHLARLKDWNHNGFPPAGGQAMLLPNFVE
ncbi:hypothetical protein TNCV_797131 [Trichonephila clavipes]|uniref:Uncharacterized protein n=1 Tax=Trichonephila clavipes TaxID=2585209 RepID=A0A8X6WI23_TRICX|nr:hypothetical protein TNCV_797131 [Trichonephila clavipes]